MGALTSVPFLLYLYLNQKSGKVMVYQWQLPGHTKYTLAYGLYTVLFVSDVSVLSNMYQLILTQLKYLIVLVPAVCDMGTTLVKTT